MISQTTASKYVSVEAKELASALKLANSIIEVRNTIPILNDVRLSYGKKGLSVEATDLDLHATIHVDEVEGAGTWSLCVPARFLAAVASAAGTGWVHIEPAQVETKNEKTGATSIRHSAEIRAGVASTRWRRTRQRTTQRSQAKRLAWSSASPTAISRLP